MQKALLVVGIGAIVLGVGWWLLAQKGSKTPLVESQEPLTGQAVETASDEKNVIEEQGAAIGDENLAIFKCDGGKTITAVFERDIVGLTLSDGRQITLRQAESGSGIRYLSNDAKIEFSGKGSEGTLVESGKTTYANCVASN